MRTDGTQVPCSYTHEAAPVCPAAFVSFAETPAEFFLFIKIFYEIFRKPLTFVSDWSILIVRGIPKCRRIIYVIWNQILHFVNNCYWVREDV